MSGRRCAIAWYAAVLGPLSQLDGTGVGSTAATTGATMGATTGGAAARDLLMRSVGRMWSRAPVLSHAAAARMSPAEIPIAASSRAGVQRTRDLALLTRPRRGAAGAALRRGGRWSRSPR